MIKKYLSVFMIFFATVTFVNAQTGTVVGTIVDGDGLPLIGANVVVKGTTVGTISNIEGEYELTGIPSGSQVLVSSFIGFSTMEMPVVIEANKSVSINFALIEDITSLDELIVIGYGVQKKQDKTGAVTTVSSKDFNQGSITSAQELVTGKIAGVQITSGGGAPGSGSTIRVRGGSSVNASNDPLIIIDGVPIDNDGVAGMRNPLNTINPNDIETFTVLKDASATAIYGSRASNGVIIINTKSGSEGQIKINYQGSVSLNTVTKTVGVLDADSYRETIKNAYPLYTSLMGDSNTDWNDEIFDNSISTNHTVAISGKTGFLPYRVSVGYDENNGILKTSELDRLTTSVNLNPSFFDDKLKVKANVKYMHVKNNFANDGAIGSAMTMDPTQIAYDMDTYSDYGGYYTWTDAGGPITIAPSNPLAQLEQKTNEANVNRLIGNVQLDYKLHFLPEVKLNLNLGGDYSFSDGQELTDALAAWDAAAFLRGGSIHNYKQEKRNELLEYYMSYDKEIPNLKSKFNILGGYSYQHFWSQDENHTFYNIPDSEGNVDSNPYDLDKTENYLVSFFGRFNYSLDEKYLLTGTMRYDGSSMFKGDNQWGLFPALAFAWRINKENFLEDVTALSDLKLRLGYGVTGQQEIDDNDYPALGTYTISQSTAGYLYYDENNGTYDRVETLVYRPNGYDENLKWEETTTYNIGIDYGLFADRFTGSLEAYYRKTIDLINSIPIAAGSNFTNYITTNVGNTKNTGIELSLVANVISTSDLNWKVGVNGAYNNVEVTKLTVVDDPDYIGVTHGSISGGTGNTVKIHQVGETPGSFFVYQQVYDNDGNPIEGEYEDLDGDGLTNNDTDDLRAYKSAAPDFILGFNTSLSYKKWDMALSGHGSFGNYVYNNVASNGAYTDRLVTSGQFLSNLTDDIYNTGFQRPQYLSDYYVQNASFFRVDNVTVGYNFKPLNFKDVRLRVYGSVNNVFVLTGYDGIDPEVYDGIDNNLYPRPRVFLLGVNMSF
jgi:iron complex outermembrane receptor protein